MMDIDNVIGNYLLDLRRQAGLDQSGFAERINQVSDAVGVRKINQKTVSRWETGMSLPALPYLRAMSLVFDLSVEKLLDAYDMGYFQRTSISKEEDDFNIGLNLQFSSIKDYDSLVVFIEQFLFAQELLNPGQSPAGMIVATDQANRFGFTDGLSVEKIDVTKEDLLLLLDGDREVILHGSLMKNLKPFSTHHNYCYDIRMIYEDVPVYLWFSFMFESDPNGYAGETQLAD